MDLEEFKEKVDESGGFRSIKLSPHMRFRAGQRRLEWDKLKEKIETGEIDGVEENRNPNNSIPFTQAVIIFIYNEQSKSNCANVLPQKRDCQGCNGDERMSSLEFNYSSELDILSVDDSSREYKRSIRTGNFVIDLDPEGSIRGVEIQNVSEMMGIDREQLSNISSVELEGRTDDEVQLTLRVKIDRQVNTLTAQITGSEVSA